MIDNTPSIIGAQESTNNEDKILKLKIMPYNEHLVNTRKEIGFTQAQVSLMTGINVFKMGEIETLKRVPTDFEKGEIAATLDKPVEFLFPKELDLMVDTGILDEREKYFSSPQVQALRMSYTDENIEKFEEIFGLKGAMNDALKMLTPREQKVLELRFGLGIGRCKTFEEVGVVFNVTRERIRQIEAKALRKLRHPTRSRKLRGFLH